MILLLLDGMRWDLFGVDMPALQSVERNGVRLDWLDTVFPTMSSPSMFSIATGKVPSFLLPSTALLCFLFYRIFFGPGGGGTQLFSVSMCCAGFQK